MGDGRTYPAGKLVRFGYVELSHEKEQKESCYLKQGEVIKGHEFHYWDSSDNGEGLTAAKPDRRTSWKCVHTEGSLFAGYPHLYAVLSAVCKAFYRSVQTVCQRKRSK